MVSLIVTERKKIRLPEERVSETQKHRNFRLKESIPSGDFQFFGILGDSGGVRLW